MIKTIKKQLRKKINVAIENNELTAQKMYNIAYEIVMQTTNAWDEETSNLHAIIKDIVTLSIQALVKAKVFSQDKIFAILQGVLDGVKKVKSRKVNNIKNELIEEEQILANNLRTALNGAQEATESFTKCIKDDIEEALAETKLKHTELLGITNDTVKQAIFNAIETSTRLENDIISIACGATTNALAESEFNTEHISKVTEKVLLAAVEAAEEIDEHILLTASAATEGVRQGLIKSIETSRESITKTRSNLLTGDLEQIQKGLESVGNLFTETLRKVADKSDKPAKAMLHELAHDAQKAGSTLREKAVLATQTVADQIEELGETLPDKTEKNRKKQK